MTHSRHSPRLGPRHPRHPCRVAGPSTGAVLSRSTPPVDLRAESPGVHQGFGEYSRSQPHAFRLDERCVAALEGGTRTATPSPRSLAATATVLDARQRQPPWFAWTTSTAAPSACSSACAAAPGSTSASSTSTDRPRWKRRDPPEHAPDLGRDADQPDAEDRRPRGAWPRSRSAASAWRWSTTPSPRRSCSAR